MFTKVRRKRRSTMMKQELGQSVEHFRRAAALAAQETSATVGPRFSAARDRVQPAAAKARSAATGSWDSALAALTPLVAAAGDTSRQASKKTAKVNKASKKAVKANAENAKKLEKRTAKALSSKSSGGSGSRLMRLALAGAAIGAAGAYVLRRRNAAQWDEYDPTRPVESVPQLDATGEAAFEPLESTTTGYATGAAGATAATGATGSAFTGNPAVTSDKADQTSSVQHSPEVARLASGQNTPD